jgi:hypothetical protein
VSSYLTEVVVLWCNVFGKSGWGFSPSRFFFYVIRFDMKQKIAITIFILFSLLTGCVFDSDECKCPEVKSETSSETGMKDNRNDNFRTR